MNRERNDGKFSEEKTISIATMKLKPEGNGADISSIDKYKVLRVGDIAFEGHTNKVFKYGRFVLNDVEDGIMSPRFSTLRPLHNYPITFWKQYINYEPIMRQLLVNATKAGTMMNELVVSDLNKQMLLIPNVKEQEKIGSLFKQIDTTLALHQ